MNLYVSHIEESYKDTVIDILGNSGTSDLLLHIVTCWTSCAVNEENEGTTTVLYCSRMMYKYYDRLDFLPIKKIRKKRYSQWNIQQYTTFYRKPSAW